GRIRCGGNRRRRSSFFLILAHSSPARGTRRAGRGFNNTSESVDALTWSRLWPHAVCRSPTRTLPTPFGIARVRAAVEGGRAVADIVRLASLLVTIVTLTLAAALLQPEWAHDLGLEGWDLSYEASEGEGQAPEMLEPGEYDLAIQQRIHEKECVV